MYYEIDYLMLKTRKSQIYKGAFLLLLSIELKICGSHLARFLDISALCILKNSYSLQLYSGSDIIRKYIFTQYLLKTSQIRAW